MAFLNEEMLLASVFSPMKVSGQTFLISSSLFTTWPLLSTSTTSVSNAFRVS